MKRFNKHDHSAHPDIIVSAENLNSIDKRQLDLFGSKAAFLRELAYSICKCSNGVDELLEKYLQFAPGSTSKENMDAHPASNEISRCFSAISIPEKVGICREIDLLTGSKYRLWQIILGESKSCSNSAKGKISYLKNNFTDEAYLTFSSSIKWKRHYPREHC